jgi:hypothetical protein
MVSVHVRIGADFETRPHPAGVVHHGSFPSGKDKGTGLFIVASAVGEHSWAAEAIAILTMRT